MPSESDRLFQAAKLWHKDPLAFVQGNYPWGEGELAGFDGPDNWQAEVLSCVRDNLSPNKPLLIAISGGVGPGKGLRHGEPVLTPNGWVPVETIQVGDLVISGDGTPTKVIGVYPQGLKQTYRVTMTDGGSVVVDDSHSWLTWSHVERKRHRAPTVKSTAEILQKVTARQNTPNHLIPTVKAVDHPTAILPVEPYVLGFWLGDGSKGGRVGALLPDKVVALGGMTRTQLNPSNDRIGWVETNIISSPVLRMLGLSGCRAREKFIPDCYFYADIHQRIALLQGLLDTDGTCGADDNSVTFDSMSLALANGVAQLTFSLGGVARRGEKRAMLNGKDYGTLHRVYVSLPEGIAPFRLPSKAARYNPNWKHKNSYRMRRRYIRSVEDAGIAETTCLRVAHPSHLFVTKDYIVTHNTTLASWLVDWAMSTCSDCRVQVTANTGPQLSTRTWPELSKWYRLSLFNSWFEFGNRRIRSIDPKRAETWRCDAITWDESNPESFRGLHNRGRRIVIIYDESSSIPDVIWEASEGALSDSDTEIIWLVLGNPTRNTGRFRQCFPGGAQAHRWKSFSIDTRRAKMSNKAQIQEWIDTYGIDHDFVRVNVLSQFPRAGDTQFIGTDLVAAAVKRETSGTLYDPLIVGVDPARFGDDEFVIRFRRGLDARSIKPLKFRGIDTMQGAARIAEINEQLKPDAIFIDDGGLGAGVLDRCRYLHLPVTGVTFGGKADRLQLAQSGAVSYANKRAEIWGLMKDWLAHGGIDNDPSLMSDLTNVEYGYKMIDGRDAIMLERKEDMKKRGLRSPNDGDALALTFAYPVGQSDHSGIIGGKSKSRHTFEYNPMEELYRIRR